ncbi:hypothetical protein [Thioalkalivibrio sp. ALJT]|uniref:hypothetical protein n=1 Tax=Thioalkalivibrio sp. ALJT TaxID=1158146 RepID=UPI000362ACD3
MHQQSNRPNAPARERPAPAGEADQGVAPASRLSMHANVTVWCDCCSCEAEPYWAEQAAALGIELDPGDHGEP